ncbi:MAG: 30S ribosomal protein S9 [Ignavibacteria bacterium]|nr:30S ribosomal protein S9 [Ignavibacteria bacterium]
MSEKIAVGRRKSSVARVAIRLGSGNVIINDKPAEKYFPTPVDLKLALEPVTALGFEGKYDFYVNVKGGGVSGQIGATRLGIARAIVMMEEEARANLRKLGFLTRDPRMVERKKYGRPKARKRFQFSKR